ncbi:MAG: hypothetical protein KatS3mg057_0896 [Herpetosiphonaceae bacterium]|nr:MAG: hypothetical protein KatS3mg057_0896 [Herpetosiphonaceae bacterium]
MQYPAVSPARSARRRIACISVLGLLTLIVSFAAQPLQTLARPKVQPHLLALAEQHPDTIIGIIVQKQVAGNHLEQQVAALGGRVTHDLHIINSFAAVLPGRAVAQLARAEGVRWISLDAPVVETAERNVCPLCIDTSNLKNTYIKAVRADTLWNTESYLQGQGIGVAVVDSGIADPHNPQTLIDFSGGRRIVAIYESSSSTVHFSDRYGHGTHVAGIIGGDGAGAGGAYIGVAPKVNLISVKVSGDHGPATASDLVAGLQWIYENRDRYNIRVVNISLNSSVNESYHTSPLNAAAEILWFNGIVVVVSAGNAGTSGLYPPANDPFVITVGAADDRGTADIGDDQVAPFSAHGLTVDGFAKPDLVAPGVNLVSVLVSRGAYLPRTHPDHIVYNSEGDANYFRMSGTSMAAPVVAGAVALLLQDEPGLTPDQVKYRLKATAVDDPAIWPAYNPALAGAGYLDIFAAVNGTTSTSANTGTQASKLLMTGSESINWNSTTWDSVNWGSVNWGSVNWGSVNWGSVSWDSTFWDD